MPTSLENHKDNIKDIVEKYGVETVLELGLETGIATEEFLKCGVKVDTIDIKRSVDTEKRIKSKGLDENWSLILGDVETLLPKITKQYDLVYMDITYYDGKFEYGSGEALDYGRKCWKRDIEICWKVASKVLVVNDYINDIDKRTAPCLEFNRFACKVNRFFRVYPTRGGMAVICK